MCRNCRETLYVSDLVFYCIRTGRAERCAGNYCTTAIVGNGAKLSVCRDENVRMSTCLAVIGQESCPETKGGEGRFVGWSGGVSASRRVQFSGPLLAPLVWITWNAWPDVVDYAPTPKLEFAQKFSDICKKYCTGFTG